MKNLLLQARVLSDPVNNPLIGWWLEHHFFYVKHRDLDARDLLTQMVLVPGTSMASLQSSTGTDGLKYYFQSAGGEINWLKLCLKRIVEDYFRNESDGAWNTNIIDDVPLASFGRVDFMDSAMNDAERALSDVDVEGPDANTTIQASEVADALRTWNLLRNEGLTEMTYEDWLGTFGVRMPQTQNYRPELLRSVRDWQYPSSYVEPTTGVPSAALSWKVAERADKDRYFREPGWIVGVQVCRPKVYMSGQTSTATILMRDALSWLPAIMRDDVLASWKKVAATSQPLSSNTDAYWIDLKDLLLYGEQFFNYAPGTAGRNHVGQPLATLARRYPTSAQADAMFKSASPANKIRTDGITSLSIMGALTDTSPTR